MPFRNLVEYLCGVESPRPKPGERTERTPWVRVVRGVLAEFVGTAFLVFFCAASATAAAQFPVSAAQVVLIGAIQGFAVVALVSALAHISGGHINPAVTLGLFVMGKIPFVRALAYVLAQCCGGLIGAGLLAAAVPRSNWFGLGSTVPAPFMSEWNAFFFEFMVTAAFIFVVVATAADQSCRVVHLAPIPIGFALGIGVWAANPFTGGSLNVVGQMGGTLGILGATSRDLASQAGPLGGALIASLFYRFVLIERQPPEERSAAPRHAAPQGAAEEAAEKA